MAGRNGAVHDQDVRAEAADPALVQQNPAFTQWSPNSPDGHLDQVHIQIGVTPEQAVNETISGSLDWYMEAVPPDRLTELKAKYPDQVHLYPRNNVTYFSMNERKAPFDKLQVRQAVNYAIDRTALIYVSNTDNPEINQMIDQAKLLPLGAERNAAWAKIDNTFMEKDAGWAPFLHLQEPKFVSSRLHGLVFTGSYFELIPEMWLSK